MSAANVREAITTLGLWHEDGTYTFPDGTTFYRDEPLYQSPLLEEVKPAQGRWVEEFPHFSQALADKLRQGYEEYGDGSFARSPEHILDELSQEALDLAGWGFILWVRLRDLQRRERA
jgi:hypothetical protein